MGWIDTDEVCSKSALNPNSSQVGVSLLNARVSPGSPSEPDDLCCCIGSCYCSLGSSSSCNSYCHCVLPLLLDCFLYCSIRCNNCRMLFFLKPSKEPPRLPWPLWAEKTVVFSGKGCIINGGKKWEQGETEEPPFLVISSSTWRQRNS